MKNIKCLHNYALSATNKATHFAKDRDCSQIDMEISLPLLQRTYYLKNQSFRSKGVCEVQT